jgi:hypothetical protein
MTLSVAVTKSLPRQQHFAGTLLLFLAGISGGIAVIGTALVEESIVASCIITLLVGGIATLLLLLEGGAREEQRRLHQLFWIAFGLRLLFMAFLHVLLKDVYGTRTPYWQHGPDGGDERIFFESAYRYSLAWHKGAIGDVRPYWYEYTMLAWLHIVAFIRFIGQVLDGDTVFNVKLFVTACGALAVPFIYKIARRLFDERTARVAALIAVFLPDFWYMASSIMRDTFICLLVLYTVTQMMNLCLNKFQIWRLATIFLINIYIVQYIRGQLSIVIIMLLVGLACVHHWRRLTKGIAPVMVLAALAVALLVIPLSSLTSFASSESLQKRSNNYVERAITGANDDSLGQVVQRLPLPVRAPLSAAQLLLLPIPPWGPLLGKGFTPRGVVEAIAGLIWFFAIVPLLPLGLIKILPRNLARTVWVWGPILLFAFVLGISGGILVRWRLMLTPFLVIVAARGSIARRSYPLVRLLAFEGILLLLAAYLTLKYMI